MLCAKHGITAPWPDAVQQLCFVLYIISVHLDLMQCYVLSHIDAVLRLQLMQPQGVCTCVGRPPAVQA